MLLDAPWGAGKSYYIKKFIDELSKNYTDYTFIYFSLNGINDIKSTASNLFCNLLLRYDKNSNVYKIFKELDKTKSSLIDFVNYAKPFVQTFFSKNNELSSHRFCLQSVCYQTCFVNFIRSFVAQPLMNPFTIEELYKFPETFSQFLCA